MNNKILYYAACIFLIVKACNALLDLVLIKDNPIINGSVESLSYKIGLVIGMIAEVLLYVFLLKIIFQKFIMKKSLTEMKSVENI